MTQGTRPNILLLCTDQQRFDTLGCYGNPHAISPTLDHLAQEGTLFEQCYTQNPICSPSRASMLTGQYVHNHGQWTNGTTLSEDKVLFSHVLAESGYDCGLIGKLHLSPAFGGRTEKRLRDGFRFFQWAHDPSQNSPENAYHKWLRAKHPDLYAAATQDDSHSRGLHETTLFDDMPTEAHYTRWAADTAIDFLADEREKDKPFFLWVNFFDPHHPFVAPREYLDKFDPARLPAPIARADWKSPKPPAFDAAYAQSYAGHARGFKEHSEAEIRDIVAAYYAMVNFIDDEVARILAVLDEQGLRENTLVVFASDHGEMLGDHGVLLKGPLLSEGAVRVPLILRWPGVVPEGERRGELVQLLDLCTTFTAAAGLERMPTDQGMDLLPLARAEPGSAGRGWALCEYRNSVYANDYVPPAFCTMLRTGTHKLVVYHGEPASGIARTGELYDLAADPQELHNLWDDPGCAALRTQLQELLLDVLVATEERSLPVEADW